MSEKSTVRFWDQLKERRVFRAVVTYAVVTFVIIQIADATFEALDFPDSAIPWLLAFMSFLFPFVVTAAWLYEFTPKGIVVDERFGTAGRHLEIGFIVLIFVIFLGASVALGFLATSEAPPKERFARDRPTIAVLPFVSFSRDDVSYLGFGIADQLLSVLDNLTEFNIVGRTSSFLLAEQNLSMQEMGEILGADHIVEGSVVLEGDRVLITAQLIESATLLHVWSASYERNLTNVIDLEQEIAQSIARAMNVTLSASSDKELHTASEVDAEAYVFYLQGKDYLRRPPSRGSLGHAIELFNKALAAEPDFVDAETGLCQAQLALFRVTLDPLVYPEAMSVCLRVASQEPKSAQALVAVGELHRLNDNPKQAEAHFREAIALDPKLPRAYQGLGRALAEQGELELAESNYQQAIDVEPSFALGYRRYGFFLAMQGRLTEASVQFEKAVELNPDDVGSMSNLGNTYFDTNSWEKAEDIWTRALEVSRDLNLLVNLATLRYYQGNYAAAVALLEEAAAKPNPNYQVYGKLGAAERQRGNIEAATRAFTRAISLAEEVADIGAPDARLMATLASFFANLGEFDQAAAYLTQALNSDPENPDVRYYEALVLRLQGEQGVEAALRRAVALGYPARLLDVDPLFADYDPLDIVP